MLLRVQLIRFQDTQRLLAFEAVEVCISGRPVPPSLQLIILLALVHETACVIVGRVWRYRSETIWGKKDKKALLKSQAHYGFGSIVLHCIASGDSAWEKKSAQKQSISGRTGVSGNILVRAFSREQKGPDWAAI